VKGKDRAGENEVRGPSLEWKSKQRGGKKRGYIREKNGPEIERRAGAFVEKKIRGEVPVVASNSRAKLLTTSTRERREE